MSKFNILKCDQECVSCIHGYQKKFDCKKGDTFQVSCSGIPQEFISKEFQETMPENTYMSMLSIFDPVTWAKEMLDWHCEDPDGAVWKRKTLENTLGQVTPYKPEYEELCKQGKSAFHRPYQKGMLRCSSKRKVFRCGRQIGKSEVLCIAILHGIFTNKNFQVLVVTPFQTQVELIFNKIIQLIKTNPVLSNSVKRFVKAPNYTIELHNGSTVKGFTAGTKSAGNADSVRGQKANFLAFDEADYLNDGDVSSALAVITNYPDATVWMSSTPTGKRERFYESCHNPMYKEYHYPSWLNPLWSDDLEKFYRGEYDQIGYEHEIAASFGEQTQGVYQNVYVDAAMYDYKYSDTVREPGWIYSIGVDWNDIVIGTTICVTGFNPETKTFKVFDTHIVEKDRWTQHAACQKIIDYNRVWKPHWIYIDKGFGHVQHEILTKFGWDAISNLGLINKSNIALEENAYENLKADSRLREIVKQYDFGSKIEILDPFTKQKKNKAAKPFLVENSVRRFEQKCIQFSKYDKSLQAQLRGYIIDHLTVSGSPVYLAGDAKAGDHMLDALNLSLIPFVLETGPFGKATFDTTIGFSETFAHPKKEEDIKNLQPVDYKQQSTKPSKEHEFLTRAEFANKHSNTKLWEHPGFLRDAPPPTSRSKGMSLLSPRNKGFSSGRKKL